MWHEDWSLLHKATRGEGKNVSLRGTRIGLAMEDRDSEGLGKKGAANRLHPFFYCMPRSKSCGCYKIKTKKLLEHWSVGVME
jgi:hypothetical protein